MGILERQSGLARSRSNAAGSCSNFRHQDSCLVESPPAAHARPAQPTGWAALSTYQEEPQTQSVKHGVRRGPASRHPNLRTSRNAETCNRIQTRPVPGVHPAARTPNPRRERPAVRRETAGGSGMPTRTHVPEASWAGRTLQAFTPNEYTGQERNRTRLGRNSRPVTRTVEASPQRMTTHRYFPGQPLALVALRSAPSTDWRLEKC